MGSQQRRRTGPADRRPRPRPGRPPRRTATAVRRNRRLARFRAATAAASLVVLLVTGYGWTNYRQLQTGLATSDVTSEQHTDGATDILLVGMDSRTDAHGNPLPEEVLRELHATSNEASLTDTVILLHVPNDGSSAVGFSFPRDSFVEIPGHGQHKINSAFVRGSDTARAELVAGGLAPSPELERRSAEAGRKLLVRTVEQLTGTSVDHYAEVNLLGFARITEAVGGVPVCLKSAAHDPYSGADFAAGRQTVVGAEALAFVRQRHGLPRGDLDRVVRQQAFLAGLAGTVLSGDVLANPARLRALIDSVQQSLVLDDDWDIFAFAERMRGLAGGAVRFTTIPIEDAAYPTSDGMAVQVDPQEVRGAIARATGQSPAATAPAVTVLDGTGDDGLAERVRERLSAQGITVTEVSGTERTETSSVRYAPGLADAGERVASALGELSAEQDDALAPGQVEVVLGEDYRGRPRWAPRSRWRWTGRDPRSRRAKGSTRRSPPTACPA
ncbi:LCP family protein [Saccharopolyspora sp. CA-218241]|uniref:LCP family protein n=1 Tax=Saccharopolyspora sp. CA-218241 TaxID=3240027 RepID=UPI003D96EBA6